MFAIDHAATALIIKRRFPSVSLVPLLIASLFSAAIPGPESFLAGRPMVIVTLILVQIVATQVLVGVFARHQPTHARRESLAGLALGRPH